MADVLSNHTLLSASRDPSLSFSSEKASQKTSSLAAPCLSSSKAEALRTSGFHGRKLVMGDNKVESLKAKASPSPVKMALAFPKAAKWWEKGTQPNMIEIDSANDLVHCLRNAGDRLVVVNFFSPGCAGCRALHPKICQFAELNPDVQFLTINYEKHKSMCYSLNVHVLPFFRFYRGAQGRVCSFSCTNATIKKFRDALAKHTPDRCSLGPAMGLEEKELLALAANKDLGFSYEPKPAVVVPGVDDVPVVPELPLPATPSRIYKDAAEKNLVAAG